MADAEHLALEVILATSQQDVELFFHGFAHRFGVDAFWRHSGDGRAAAALRGIEGQTNRLHACLGGGPVTGMAGKDLFKTLCLHHFQGCFEGEVEVDGRGEGVAVGMGRFAVFGQIQIKLRQI